MAKHKEVKKSKKHAEKEPKKEKGSTKPDVCSTVQSILSQSGATKLDLTYIRPNVVQIAVAGRRAAIIARTDSKDKFRIVIPFKPATNRANWGKTDAAYWQYQYKGSKPAVALKKVFRDPAIAQS